MTATILSDGLAFALPLLAMALGGVFCEGSGVIMLALEGLQGFGAFTGAAAVAVAISLGASPGAPWLLYAATAAAMLGGLLFSLFHALLCVKFRARQIISGVVVNTLAVALSTFGASVLNKALTGEASNKIQLGAAERFDLPFLADLPGLGGLFREMYPFEIIILAFVPVAWHTLYRTRFGFRLRACGENPQSAAAAGISVGHARTAAILICGALCGLGGVFLAYSVSASFSPNIYMGYGYLAIAAMICGNWKILPTCAACLFFGLTKSAGYQLCLTLGMSGNHTDLLLILPYVLTLAVLAFFSQHTRPPLALGDDSRQ